MKRKVLSTFLLIIVLVLACSDKTAVRLRYDAERMYQSAERSLRDYQLNRANLDRSVLRDIAAEYRELENFCFAARDSIDPETDAVELYQINHLIFQANTRLSQLYFATRQYDTCVSLLSRLIAEVPMDDREYIASNLNLGRALQSNRQWDSAKVVFERLIDYRYPPVDTAGEVIFDIFNLPLRIYRVSNLTTPEVADQDLAKAENYYNQLIEEYPNTNIEIAGHSNLGSLYEGRSEWYQAIKHLRELDRLGSEDNTAAKMRIADIYGSRLKESDRAIALYDTLLTMTDPTDSLEYPLLVFKRALVTINKEKYTEALRTLQRLKDDYPSFYARSPVVQLALAQTFEHEGNWDRALSEYTLLIDKYALTDEAMSTHLHIAQHYRDNNQKALADNWFKRAEEYFDNAITRQAGSLVEAKALIFKADMYVRLNQLQPAADMLVELFRKYPNTDQGKRAMIQAIGIYRDDLKQTDVADSLIEDLKASLAEPERDFEL